MSLAKIAKSRQYTPQMSESVPKPYGLRQKTGPQRTFFTGIVYLYVLKKT